MPEKVFLFITKKGVLEAAIFSALHKHNLWDELVWGGAEMGRVRKIWHYVKIEHFFIPY